MHCCESAVCSGGRPVFPRPVKPSGLTLRGARPLKHSCQQIVAVGASTGLAGLRDILQPVVGGEVVAELLRGGEEQSLDTEGFGGADVLRLVVEEEAFGGGDAEMVAGEPIDGGIGLGDVEFAGPGEVGEAAEPGEVRAMQHGVEDFGDHVRQDGGAQAGLLQRVDPGEHDGVGLDPHADVGCDESFEFGRRENAAGVRGETLPETGPVEEAEVVLMAVAPVDGFEGGTVEAGDREQILVGGVVAMAEDFAVVKDDSAH